MPRAATALAILSAGVLAACAADRGPERVETANPTVTYEYEGEEEFEQAAAQAEGYCEDFGRDARLVDTDERDDDDDVAVFECR